MSDLGLCIVCDKPLRGGQVKCCSVACVRAMQTLPPEPCSQCGKPVPRRGRLTCSAVCANEASGGHHPSRDVWTDRKLAELRQLWAEGLSARKIGLALGVSKNAVVGKVDRLDLPRRPSPIRHGTARPRVPRAPRNTIPLFDRIQRPSHEPEVRMLFDTLTPRQSASLGRKPPRPPEPKPQPKPEPFSVFRTCQFIEAEDRKAYRFCDQPTQAGSSYCPTHHRRCYVPRQALDDGMKTAA